MNKEYWSSHGIARWLPVVLRVIAVTVTLYPAVRKFLEYSYRVQRFASYGIPFPELAVPLSGVVELLAIGSLTIGVAGRLGAGTLVVTMVVAIASAGPNPFSVLVLAASAGIIVTGTGPYSYWDPTLSDLLGVVTTTLSGGPQWSGGR
jgi:uncharacterized membrane protein YphA (DoxX/SURF4 family)